ncbi:hypothetical protein [Brevundimonas sp. SL130]|uniref:hypothetical protein n=1 Tax=Brevundimonas sp. SL130 TaxID=2995143 RepID=UPI00226C9B5D|nr:hypothetical protein [Brevundimonas sp. SL130]WAC60330.1 hypothetical protein OU998_02445 [Brevundimonas sp. SL130]
MTQETQRLDGECGNTIFVASDRRYLQPSPEAERVVLYQGVGVFDGLDAVSDNDARIHLIEMSRYAVEALEWGRGAQVYFNAGARLPLFQRFNIDVPSGAMPVQGTGRWDLIAGQAMQFLSQTEKAVWPSELFLFECDELSVSGDFQWRDMTGPPRAVVRGTYIWATPGTWGVTARFAVDEEGARQEFQIRWGPPLTPTVMNVTPARPGIYEVKLENTWFEPDGMELTIAKSHSAVSGLFAFLGSEVFKPS